MKISFIHTQIVVPLHVNKTSFHMNDFALGLTLKQRRKATRKSPHFPRQRRQFIYQIEPILVNVVLTFYSLCMCPKESIMGLTRD